MYWSIAEKIRLRIPKSKSRKPIPNGVFQSTIFFVPGSLLRFWFSCGISVEKSKLPNQKIQVAKPNPGFGIWFSGFGVSSSLQSAVHTHTYIYIEKEEPGERRGHEASPSPHQVWSPPCSAWLPLIRTRTCNSCLIWVKQNLVELQIKGKRV